MAIVGVDQDFKELSEEELSPYVEAVAALWVCWTNIKYCSPRMSFFTSTVYLQRLEIGVRLHRAEMLVGSVNLLLRLLRLYRAQVPVQLYDSDSTHITHCLCNHHRRSLSAFPIDHLMR